MRIPAHYAGNLATFLALIGGQFPWASHCSGDWMSIILGSWKFSGTIFQMDANDIFMYIRRVEAWIGRVKIPPKPKTQSN